MEVAEVQKTLRSNGLLYESLDESQAKANEYLDGWRVQSRVAIIRNWSSAIIRKRVKPCSDCD